MKQQIAPAISPARMFLRASFLSMAEMLPVQRLDDAAGGPFDRRADPLTHSFTSATIAPNSRAR